MAKQGNEPPEGKPAVDDRALDLLRRSSAGKATVAQYVVHATPDAPTERFTRERPAPAQTPVPDKTEPEATQGKTEPEIGIETAPAPAESSKTSEAEAPEATEEEEEEAEAEPKRRRWLVALLLLLLLLGGVTSWLVLRQSDDDDAANSLVAGQKIGPGVSLGGQPPPKDADDDDESGPAAGRRAGGSGGSAGNSSAIGTLPLAPSGPRRPGDADYRFATPGAPGSLSPETARLQARGREGGTPSSASPPGRSGGPASGSQSSSAGSGGAGNPGNEPASPAGGSGAGAAGGGAGTGAGSPPPGRPPRATAAMVPPTPARQRAARLLNPAVPDACPETPKEPVVLVFDGSVSMGLPLDMPTDIEAALDRRMEFGDEDARLEYRRWLASDQPKRIDFGKDAVRTLLRDADAKLNFGAVAFTSCSEIASRPFVTVDGRSQLAEFIGSVTPHRGGDTALADSIEAALNLLQNGGDRNGRIILLTDGKETCGGDPCALAERIKKERPGVRVDVVDLSGHSDAACLAEATGGVVLTYAETRQLMPLSRLLVRAANQCVPR